ncbi:MAG: hypothetical protein ACRDZQ_09600 [Acidimicrobiales bacterium]
MTILGDTSGEGPRVPAAWPAKAAESLEHVVGTVRSKSVRPLQTIARALVFGLIAAVMGVVLLILMAVGTIRVLNVYAFPGEEWASYVLVGGIFALAGLFVSSRKQARPRRTHR